MSYLPLFTFSLTSNRQTVIFYTLSIFLSFISYFNEFLSLGLILVFISFYNILNYLSKIEDEKESFKISVAKTIDSEIKREFEKLEFKLQTAYKKLKELFKLSIFTVKELSSSDMANKIVEGLVNMGYSGTFVKLTKEGIQKKEGFFPNYKIYVNSDEYSVALYDDNKVVLIPLTSENQNLGMIGVYSKIPLTAEEVEFLITYANTISTSIAKTNFLLEKIKLRDLVQKTIESIDLGIIVLNKEFNIELINKSAKILLREDEESENFFGHFTILKNMENEFKEVINSKKSFEKKITISENPKKIWEIKAFPILTQEETIENIVIIIEDITEKVEMENQILQSEKLAVIGRLVASISHEVKNPLSIINQSAYSLKRKINKACKENIDDLLGPIDRIERNVHRANDIVERLLNFTKPYYSKVETITLKEVLEEAIKLSFLQAKRSDISISKRLTNAYIKGDKNALVQLFINILINAIESIKNKGSIIIKTYKNKKDGKVIIKIKDTGIGIPSEYLDKIFEPFFTTKESGTGLGLAVAYRIVESHGGKIYVESEEGKGTEFTVELPLYREGDDGK
ncbi:ATP-binding protein [Sulfurihydrogenibium subterraneum]|uniref:ATP-binding protein n=1 Tax=Sulfurihydrogenibium subterraneum TaxID=171121 RepID=UPI000B07969F|nr:ATP-binding protein [Sulfurihydrogenibium subterraneum]